MLTLAAVNAACFVKRRKNFFKESLIVHYERVLVFNKKKSRASNAERFFVALASDIVKFLKVVLVSIKYFYFKIPDINQSRAIDR